ncbi:MULTISPECIES: restriction endonuclease subunit S [unclassified Tolypothrix]|uniref:restriction endonuclease subunit S n=1 Tax=unclassified Tolypothrix TaxID=2649714 RepID=UPI0005EABC26|nr:MULTISPECIES: restriction endonuclease subunit S [unclassified Tolypothrix]BAY94967.1 restriction modification system DNA specificity subunit [Microchaete diplosiphon NIES-3275]EKF00498.1 type I restriction-modification protein [Tolypothrix sp. PCC 7601]MBE9086352.1 restriction endonuclease subunit S [Tolypothrix sp. LEGE 11397]UYD28605.1 restriction endonuclease subunit S [Tolypothrix sp. PCC 7712]UYD35486.1 restriction endonuclease subunit S [Tolypothrix sp. PCC 7601]
MGKDLYELPKGWVWTTIGEATECLDYQRVPVSKEERAKRLGNIPYYGANGLVDYIDDYIFDEPLVLVVEDETFVGREKPFSYKITGKTWVNNHAHILRSNGCVDIDYLNYSLWYYPFTPLTTGTTGRRKLTKSALISAPYVLPPLPEQHRIVTKIEELFTQLDAGVELLKKVKAKLKRYRQAVLKAAVEGNLTKEWREANQGELEPASVLLERILNQRREKWEAEQLAKMKAQGKTPKDDSWKLKYKEPTAPDTSDLPELPDEWVWVTMEMLTIQGPQNGIYLPKSDYGSGIPILRIDDFQDNFSRSSCELNLVRATTDDIERYSLSEDDLVINRVNSPSHLGKCLVVTDKHIPSLFESNMMRLHLSSFYKVLFAAYYLRSVIGKSRLISNAKWAVNQASINQTDVGNTAIPLLPIEEQQKVIEDVTVSKSLPFLKP